MLYAEELSASYLICFLFINLAESGIENRQIIEKNKNIQMPQITCECDDAASVM